MNKEWVKYKTSFLIAPIFIAGSLLLNACMANGQVNSGSNNGAAAAEHPVGNQPVKVTLANATSVAEGFVRTAISGDLTQARQFFAPDKQPLSWGNAFIADGFWRDTRTPNRPQADLSGCINIPYNTVERVVGVYKTVTIVFASACVEGNVAVGLLDIKRINVSRLQVALEQANNRWYVTPSFTNGNQVTYTQATS